MENTTKPERTVEERLALLEKQVGFFHRFLCGEQVKASEYPTATADDIAQSLGRARDHFIRLTGSQASCGNPAKGESQQP